jgi:hypothetical protein
MAKRKISRDSSAPGSVPRVHGLTKKTLKINFVMPDNPPPALFSNQMLVQSDGMATYLSFFQTEPPVIFGKEADVQKKIDELESLQAHLVARIVVPQDRMGAFFKVLTKTYEAKSEMQ